MLKYEDQPAAEKMINNNDGGGGGSYDEDEDGNSNQKERNEKEAHILHTHSIHRSDKYCVWDADRNCWGREENERNA